MDSLRAKLESGRIQFGLCMMYPAPGVIERIGADWDWIWIDSQHGELDYNDVLGMVRACELMLRPSLVRVAGHDYATIGRTLDTGAAGIIVPCVDSAEQASALVQAAKFPPQGERSFGGRRVIDVQGRSYVKSANREVLLIAQIETPRALENVEAIAAVPGIDCLFLGPDDLRLRRGDDLEMPADPQSLMPAVQAVASACRAHSKFSFISPGGSELMKYSIEAGFNLIVGGADANFLSVGSKNAATAARNLLETP